MKRRRIYYTVLAALALSTGPALAGELASQLGILDLTANGGINPATGSPWQAGDQYRLVFLSSATTNATSTDITTYDAFVQGLADTAGLGGTWKVLGSTSTVNAKDHTSSNEGVNPSTIPVFLIDGSTVVANNYAQLWYAVGDPIAGINKDETGTANPLGLAFTGNDRYGVAWAGNALGDSTVGKGYAGVPDWRLFGAGSWGGNTVDVPPSNGWLPNAQERPVYAMSDPLVVSAAGVPNIIDIEVDGSGNVVLRLDGPAAGLTVQQSNDLTADSFANVTSTVTDTNELTVAAGDTDPDADGADFYRVSN